MLVCFQILIEKAMDQQAFIMFINYSKAFDSVCHSQIFGDLLEMGFHKHLVAPAAAVPLCKPESNHQME